MSDRIRLQKGDYFELRAIRRDIEAIELEAMRAAQSFHARVASAQQRVNAALTAAATKYGLDPAVTYTWDDATCELITAKEP